MDFLDPEKVIQELGARPDMIAVDFGSGSGRFSLPLAKKLHDGVVWALDIQKEPLEFLKSRCIKENIHNINFSCCDLEQPKGSKLKGSSFDLALAVDIMFYAKDTDAIISEAHRILKNKGTFFVSDKFDGAPSSRILSAAKRSKLALKREINLGEHRYGLIFEKI